MSAGAFIITGYQSTATGEVHPIRVQPETLTLSVAGTANAAPAGAPTSPISAQVSQGNRSLGLNARTVTIKFPTAAPDGYKVDSPFSLPWLTETGFAGFVKGAEVTYLGATGVLVGTKPEKAN